MDLLGRGQGVFGIAVGRVLREVEASLVNIKETQLDTVDELSARRQGRKVSSFWSCRFSSGQLF